MSRIDKIINRYRWIFPKKINGVKRFIAVALLMVVALGLRLAMAPVEAGLQYITFFPAVALAVVFAGFWAGIFASVIGIVLATYIFTVPYYSLGLASFHNSLWSNSVFLIDTLVVCFSIEAMHRYRNQIAQKLDSTNQSLIDTHERLSSVLEQNLNEIYLFDTKSLRYEYANAFAITNLGYSLDSLQTMTPVDIKPEFDEPSFRNLLAPLLQGDTEQVVYETIHHRADGSEYPVEVHTQLAGARERSVFVSFVLDITERKKSEQALLQAKEEAERSSHAKSEFLTRMSHELRTPMNAILGFSQVLEEEPLLPQQQDYVQEIHHAGNHLLELINDLLDISSIEAGKIGINIEAVRLAPLITQAVQFIRPLMQEMNITLNNQCADNITLLADATRLKQILVNLLSNAAKYNCADGRIVIACQPLGAERLRVMVTDTGKGIPEESMTHIFTPFERLGMLDNTTIEGTGVGLALAQSLAQLMDGDIGVESIPGQGSTFWVELPRLTSVPEDAAPQRFPIDESHDGFKLLYIEDNSANLRVVEAMLRKQHNITLISAGDGNYGLELAQRYLPEVILLDIKLPGMDGFEVLKALQSLPETRDIPVIAISADALPIDVQRGLDAGFRYYLTKPIEKNELIEAIRRFQTI